MYLLHAFDVYVKLVRVTLTNPAVLAHPWIPVVALAVGHPVVLEPRQKAVPDCTTVPDELKDAGGPPVAGTATMSLPAPAGVAAVVEASNVQLAIVVAAVAEPDASTSAARRWRSIVSPTPTFRTCTRRAFRRSRFPGA